MLRIRRSVQATYNTRVSFIANQLQTSSTESATVPTNEMQKLEQVQDSSESGKPTLAGRPMVVFQSAGIRQLGLDSQLKQDQTRSTTKNKEAINIDDLAGEDEDDDDDAGSSRGGPRFRRDDDETDMDLDLEKQPVPSAVFGSLKDDNDD
ncbi:unnamed protein product [Echinostoma caproni]|uniref:DUF4604 domain-containing protein n=1 Tax=Echinostoma caproni TaxID=27848 RepID=A0A183B2X2_9TREM|nr:unnamed protein product [Echinostoma caproni]